MPPIEARLILAILGGAFLLLAGWQWWQRRTLAPSGRTWLLVAAIFGCVTAWLSWLH